jgi:F0F1-type ATP synthase epsilon subunit
MAMRQNASTGELVNDAAASGKKAPPKQIASDKLNVKVWSPFQVYYDGEATSVSGVNGTGSFDILPQHHNFITLLNACDLALQTRDGEVKIRISGGVMRVQKDVVTVFLEV